MQQQQQQQHHQQQQQQQEEDAPIKGGQSGDASTRRRRQSYTRSVTLQESDHDDSSENSQLIAPTATYSPLTYSRPRCDEGGRESEDSLGASPEVLRHPAMSLSISADEQLKLLHEPSTSASGSSRHRAMSSSKTLSVSSSKRASLKQRSASVNNARATHLTSRDLDVEMSHKARGKLGRTPSTPSVLLSRVRDRIREKVFQTSTEWPQAAAIVHERRQRAVESFEARLSRKKSGEVEMEQVPMKDLHNRRKRGRNRSDPIPAVVATVAYKEEIIPSVSVQDEEEDDDNTRIEEARQSFRRRSISEDTYDRPPKPSTVYRHSADSGIICSNTDLKAMKTDFHKKRSPRPMKALRTFSCDAGRSSSNTLIESRMSVDSASSGYSARSGALTDGESIIQETIEEHRERVQLPTEQPKAHAPLLGEDMKGTSESCRSVTLKSSTLLYGSLDEGPPGCSEDGTPAKPVREIVFDDKGQTWDVYGAEFDPEILGEAIQGHLVRLMEHRASGCGGSDGDAESGNESDTSSEVHFKASRFRSSEKPRRQDGTRRTSSEGSNFFLRLFCPFRSESEVVS